MKHHHFDCQCSDFGCTLRVTIDRDEEWPTLWFEYHLNHHLPWYKRLGDGLRYIFGFQPRQGFGGTMLKHEDVIPLTQLLTSYHIFLDSKGLYENSSDQ